MILETFIKSSRALSSLSNKRCVVLVRMARTRNTSWSLLPSVGILWKWRIAFRQPTGSFWISLAAVGMIDMSPEYSSHTGEGLEESREANCLIRRCLAPLHWTPFSLHPQGGTNITCWYFACHMWEGLAVKGRLVVISLTEEIIQGFCSTDRLQGLAFFHHSSTIWHNQGHAEE